MTDDQIKAAIAECRKIARKLHAEAVADWGEDAKNMGATFIEDVCTFAATRLAEPAKVEPQQPFADTTGVPVCPQCGGSKRIPSAGLTKETAWEECRACKIEAAPPVAPEPPDGLVYAPLSRVNKVRGIGRTEDSRKVILVSFDEEPDAEEMRSFHDYVRGWQR